MYRAFAVTGYLFDGSASFEPNRLRARVGGVADDEVSQIT
jgi:hypothetical protein